MVILITPPPIGEVELQKANVMKGKKIPLDRTNARYHILRDDNVTTAGLFSMES